MTDIGSTILTAIRCPICGQPTGGLVEISKYNDLSVEAKTCSDCSGVTPVGEDNNGEYACPACGATEFYVAQNITRYARVRLLREDGDVLYEFTGGYNLAEDEINSTDEVAVCLECSHRIPCGGQF